MTATDIAGAGSQQSTICSNVSVPGGSGSGVPDEDIGTESIYHLKWIQWNSGKVPIVMQSRNGPCPLIATMNVLLLREKVRLPDMLEQISDNQLLTYLGECIMDYVPADIENDENAILNLEQNIHDAIEILPKLKTGLDVNIRFTGITDFEYTPECIIFDLLRIPLYHGWLSDPTLIEVQNAIGNQSYNQLVDNIITNKTSTEPDIMTKVLISEEFLERTASQLTEHGLMELRCNINDNEIGILFRNNHFLTIFKRESEIYTLVTDHGYLTEDNIIWETLDNIDGAGRFFDSNFQASDITKKQVSVFQELDQRQRQLENDFLMALCFNEEENAEQQRLADGPDVPWLEAAQTAPLAPHDDVIPAREAIYYYKDEDWPQLKDHESRSRGETSRNPDQASLRYRNRDSREDRIQVVRSQSGQSEQLTPVVEPQQLNLTQSQIPSTSTSINPINATTANQNVVERPTAPANQQNIVHGPDQSNAIVAELPQNPPTPVIQAPSSNSRLKSERNLKESNCIVN